MPKIDNEVRKDQLVLYLARGGVAAWAGAHDIPERTACTWSRSPEVRDRTEAIRRAMVAEAVHPPGDDARAVGPDPARPRGRRRDRHDRHDRIGPLAEIDGEAP
jgi:hypothetical protein